MIALLVGFAAAAVLSILLASSRAQANALRLSLEAREAELRSEREARASECAARAAVQARLDASEEKQQRLQETFASLSREALDANTAHLVRLAEQVMRRAQEGSQAELARRARPAEEMVRPGKESLGRVDEKTSGRANDGDGPAARSARRGRSPPPPA